MVAFLIRVTFYVIIFFVFFFQRETISKYRNDVFILCFILFLFIFFHLIYGRRQHRHRLLTN